MGRAPCCDKANVKKGPWSLEEDAKLKEYIEKHGTGGNWISLPPKAGLKRCGKSCRLRWLNYLRPNIKHGEFSDDEDRIICSLYANIGSRWSIIAAQLPGRTDNDIKNYWNTKLRKKLMGTITSLRKPLQATNVSSLLQISQLSSSSLPPSIVLSSATGSSSYNSCNNPYYTLPQSSSEPLTFAPCPSSNNSFPTSTSAVQPQESFVGPAQHFQVKDNIMMLGGEASCSSSDGSSNYLINRAREMDYEYGGVGTGNAQVMGLQGYLCNGVEQNQKLTPSNSEVLDGLTENQNGLPGGSPLDYALEEIKQLIRTESWKKSCTIDTDYVK